MRLMLYGLLGVGAVALTIVLLSWFAERRLDHLAAPYMTDVRHGFPLQK